MLHLACADVYFSYRATHRISRTVILYAFNIWDFMCWHLSVS